MYIQRNLFSQDSKEDNRPRESVKRPRKNKKKEKPARTCEYVTEERFKDLAENGAIRAREAKAKGKTVDDWESYCHLMGSNNTDAWRSGWDKEWEKMNNA